MSHATAWPTHPPCVCCFVHCFTLYFHLLLIRRASGLLHAKLGVQVLFGSSIDATGLGLSVLVHKTVERKLLLFTHQSTILHVVRFGLFFCRIIDGTRWTHGHLLCLVTMRLVTCHRQSPRPRPRPQHRCPRIHWQCHSCRRANCSWP